MEAITDIIPSSLLPALALPFVELFPNLGLGWWTPPDLRLKQYVSNGWLRVMLQSLSWYPVFETLLPICAEDTAQFSLLILGVAASIIGRYFVMQKQIKRVTNVSLWDSNIPFDKRQALFTAVTYSKPSNINNFDGLCVRYVTMPSKIMGLVGALIVNILHNKLSSEEEKSRILIVLAMLVVGGIGINGTRHGSIGMDCFFRVVFGAGFVGLMYYLGKVSDIALVESVN